jgi:hypothetical protein
VASADAPHHHRQLPLPVQPAVGGTRWVLPKRAPRPSAPFPAGARAAPPAARPRPAAAPGGWGWPAPCVAVVGVAAARARARQVGVDHDGPAQKWSSRRRPSARPTASAKQTSGATRATVLQGGHDAEVVPWCLAINKRAQRRCNLAPSPLLAGLQRCKKLSSRVWECKCSHACDCTYNSDASA